METFSKSTLASLKEDICKGDTEAVRVLTEIFFGEIWANMLTGKMDAQADALINLESDLRENPADFCNSKDPIEVYLRKKWREKLAGLRKKSVTFDDAYMGVQKEELPPVETAASPLFLTLQYQYFLSSLTAVQRILFETKYYQALYGKNGLFQVTHFLLNATAIGYPELSSLLKKQEGLYEPLISSFLVRQAKSVFTNEYTEKQETLRDLLGNLPANKDDLKQAFHAHDMKVSRSHSAFRNYLEEIQILNELEQSFVLINKYLEVENHLELWIQVNVNGQHYPPLKKELKSLGLWDERIKKKHVQLGRKGIIKTFKSVKILEGNEKQMRSIQDQINKKLVKTVSWKTN
ncbi:MAG: hypothetical protein ACI8P3_001587 [Saprospiraceae bacterium]|jgi:hypothetical protein